MDCPKFPTSYKALLPLVILVAVLTLCMPRSGEFEYHYHKGSKWNYQTLVAPFSFPILKTSEQINAEKQTLSSSYVPYYRFSSDVSTEVLTHFSGLLSGYPELCEFATKSLSSYFDQGILPDDTDVAADKQIVFVQKDKRAVKTPVVELLNQSQLRHRLKSTLISSFPEINVDSVLSSSHALDCIAPNLVYDKQTTELVHQQSSDFISPTSGIFNAGDIIVSNGEIITADIEQILDSFKAEFKHTVGYNGPGYLLWMGNFLISAILSLLVFFLVMFSRPKTMEDPRKLIFILSVFLLCAIVSFVVSKFDSSIMILVPYPVFAMYFMAFLRKKFVLPLYTISLLPMLLVAPFGISMYIMFLVGGFTAVYTFSYFYRGWQQFISAVIVFATMMLTLLTFRLIDGVFPLLTWYDVIYVFLSSLFCILAYPLVFLFEKIFGLVSASRLVDLSDTSQPLLRLLAEKAPGTFQHSLAVMNMADACARAIDADIPLIRTGALYHDVGKSENPQCFIENQVAGVNYHEGLTPQESAKEITSHVTNGLALADRYGLPQVVKNFIATHHGTTTTGYFYTKYLNDGGDPSAAGEFSYPGPRPFTKEHVIMMLCDAAEASSRTLNDYSMQSVSKLVENLFHSKYQEGQFNDAAITLREMETVKETIKSHIIQMHHGRIAYPKRKK